MLQALEIWYTAREKYNALNDGWQGYKEWSRLLHLKELVSLDSNFCASVIEPDRQKEETYEVGITIDFYFTYCYKRLDYVYQEIQGKSHYNVLAVCFNPSQPCEEVSLEGFQFMGYDLLDQSHDTSALSNCGGFDESFLPTDLNEYGLLPTWNKANEVCIKLLANNPEEDHADTNVWAIWRQIPISN